MGEKQQFEWISKEKRDAERSFEILNDPEGRAELLSRMDQFIEDVRQHRPDVIVFLDKSARPLAWLFRERFTNSFPKETVPDIRFINIGRESRTKRMIKEKPWDAPDLKTEPRGDLSEKISQHQWIALTDIPKQWKEHADKDFERINEVQRIFGDQFSGKKMLFVDEISVSGKSLATAAALFAKAFPDLKSVHATAFYHEEQTEPFASGKQSLMPWFKEPGLIGVFDILDEDALLAKRVDKQTVESAKKIILQQKEQATNDLNEFVEGKSKILFEQFDRIRALLKANGIEPDVFQPRPWDLWSDQEEDGIRPEDFLRDIDWIETFLRVTNDKKSAKEDPKNLRIDITQHLPDAISFLNDYEKQLKHKQDDATVSLTISLLQDLRKKERDARVAAHLSANISDIESMLGGAKKLRNELKILAHQKE